MADRGSLFKRFWPASTSRRPPAAQTTAPPPSITNSTTAAEPKPVNQTNHNSTTRTPARQSTTTAGSPPKSTTSPTTEGRMADQPSSTSPKPGKSPSGQVQIASQPTTTTSSNPISSPSLPTTQSPSSSKPASPRRPVAQSKSSPQPSSPYHAAPQARRMGSQTPSTPKRASRPLSSSRLKSHSPKRGFSGSPKATQPTSPSKKSRQPTKEISSSHEADILAYGGEYSKPAASQQEPQLKTEVKSEHGTTTTSGHCPKTPAPSKSLQSSAVNDETECLVELNAKPEETKDVKEVKLAKDTVASKVTKKEVNNSFAPKSGLEAQIIAKAEISSKPDQMRTEKLEALETKKILATSLSVGTPAKTTTSRPQKRSIISSTHNKSALPNGERVRLDKNIRNDMSTFLSQMAVGDPQRAIYDRPVSVITLAGENRGASMQMESNSSKGDVPIHIHRCYKINPGESAEATTDGDGSYEGKNSKDANSADDQPTEAHVNNNAQGINNSIVFDSSITEGNPGVHMAVSHLLKEPIQ